MLTSRRLIAFDLDDTLAPSKTRLPDEMAELLLSLLSHVEVAVISGGNYDQFMMQLITPLSELAAETQSNTAAKYARAEGTSATPTLLNDRVDTATVSALFANLHILPTCGTRYYRYVDADWQPLYIENLTDEERSEALDALEQEAKRLGLWEPKTWGPILEDRGSQITFSALGQQAPVEAKHAWDPTGEKKGRLRDAVAARLPGLEVRSGGSTSVDITRRGIDKAYGMAKLAAETGIAYDDMLFVGDRLDPSGNDYPVTTLGIATHAVAGWEDTAALLRECLRR